MNGQPPPPQGPPPPGGYPPGPYPPAQYPPAQPPAAYRAPGAPGFDPNAPYGYDPKTGLAFSDKQKIVAGLLQIFLGSFGVGRFYLGYTGIAVAQILVTWLTCGIGGLWPLIDGILILTGNVPDMQGRPLRD